MSAESGGTLETRPIEFFLQELEYHGKSERTRSAYGRVLREFEAFLERERDGTSVVAARQRDCMAYVHQLRERKADSTVATYAAYLQRFYGYMNDAGEFDENPMTLVVEEMDEQVETDPTRRDIPLEAMRNFVGTVTHPLDRAVVVTLLKTGIRAGELCNLDSRDLHLAESPVETPVAPRIENRPRSLLVGSDPARGEVHNGEERTASNKRKRDTVVPVDDELARVLTRWLGIRPDPRSPADPLFTSTSRRWGARLTIDMVHHVVERHAREMGWYRQGGGPTENVTPHYFRHFFTTHMRERTGERGVVKYLRGDVADDVIDTYTHNWGDRVRAVYLDSIYSLGV